jgi:phospholipid/cholesterol/gamma-HCH transport system substrate-binding protein
VKRAIRVHQRDFVAILALVALAVVVAGYILLHQPAFTFGKSYYTVKADFQTGAAVTAGQGQSVDIAGVEVGQVGGITLQNGHAVVTMNIDKKYAPIYNDATVLLRPRTPLKDMYLSLDPGTPAAGAVPSGGSLTSSSTLPDINVEEILSSLDVDTRNYLLLLLAGGAQAFQYPGALGAAPTPVAVRSLQGTFKRFAPLNRDTATLTKLLAQRRINLRIVSNALGDVDGQLASLIRASNTNFAAISSQDANLQQALTLLPPTLQTTTETLGKVNGFSTQSALALHALLPFAHNFGPALQAARPLFEQTTPVLKNQLRPFSVAVQPLARILAPASADLAKSTPALARSLGVLDALGNTLGHQPGGGKQSYLFWGSWLSHIADSLTNAQDAHGAVVRGIFMASCPSLNLFETSLPRSSPALTPLLALLNAPDWSTINSPYCPKALP